MALRCWALAVVDISVASYFAVSDKGYYRNVTQEVPASQMILRDSVTDDSTELVIVVQDELNGVIEQFQ